MTDNTLPLPDEHVSENGTPVLKLKGTYRRRSKEEIEAQARTTPESLARSLAQARKDNPVLYALLRAQEDTSDDNA